MSYEECAWCNHSTEYSIEDDDGVNCSICIAQKENCHDHGMCTIDDEICTCDHW